MKKEWKKPELEILDVSLTMKAWDPPGSDNSDNQHKPHPGHDENCLDS